ncbi:DUF3375 family protein [Loktanella sp. DJP18]|uniref:DUF3375 family protein n=1 Tax=Loktanella sp. DJP18 TaxID=3409788 RepID=UPI003BB59D47
MTTMVMQHKIPNSRELRILRQDNLAFYAEINARAFRGAFMSEVPVQVYLRIIDEVKQDFISVSPAQDFTKPADFYLNLMIGKHASYDHAKSEPWLGTDIKGDTEVVVLLEPASKALRILRDLDNQQSFLAVSSLSSLSDRLISKAARLSGDASQQIDALESRRTDIDLEIAELKARGAKPLTPIERRTEIYALLNDLSQIKAGFAEVPAAKRRINSENKDLFLDSDAPVGDVLDVFWERQRAWDQSAENAVLTTLRDLHVNIAKAQIMQGSLESVVRMGDDIIDLHLRREITSFLPDMLGISNDISLEISYIWTTLSSFISNPNYAARREDARVLRAAQAAAVRIRNEVRPSPRDTRLKDTGLVMTMPLRTNPLCDLKLTTEAPVPIDEDRDLVAVAEEPDSDARRMALAKEAAKSAHLSTASIVARVKDAMGTRQEVTLSDVIRHSPLRYGRHEISRYLAVASGTMPSLLVEGMSFTVQFHERDKSTMANIVNPIFRLNGTVGEGFGDFDTASYLLTPDEMRASPTGYAPIDRNTIAA